jgi:CRP-like cAMP-binding protein
MVDSARRTPSVDFTLIGDPCASCIDFRQAQRTGTALLQFITICFPDAEMVQRAAALLWPSQTRGETIMLQEVSLSEFPVAGQVSQRTPERQSSAPQGLDAHIARAPVRIVSAKEHVFTEGDDRSHLYRVETGAICLYKVLSDGRRQVLGFAYPGDLVGLGPLGEHQFNAQATKRSRLRSLPLSTVHQIARHDPVLAIRLYEMISQELAAAHDLLLTTGQRTAMERVAAFLLAMSGRSKRASGDANTIHLPMTRSDIGDFLGLTIETVSRTFTKLRQLKIIDLEQSAEVRIRDMEGLERLAGGGGDR